MPPSIRCNFNHVGLSVENLEVAVEWYKTAFGFDRIIPDVVMRQQDDPNGIIFRIYGNQLREVKVAYMATGNQIGFELFQFIDPEYRGGTKASPKSFDEETWIRGGFFHIALTANDPSAVAAIVERTGGKRIGSAVDLPNGEQALYVQDPWGNVIELMTTDFETMIKGVDW